MKSNYEIRKALETIRHDAVTSLEKVMFSQKGHTLACSQTDYLTASIISQAAQWLPKAFSDGPCRFAGISQSVTF